MAVREVRVAVDGGDVALLDHGGDDHPPVLLVHGTGHNAAAWTGAGGGRAQLHP